MRDNIDMAKKIIRLAAPRIKDTRSCECASALSTAIVTDRDRIPVQKKEQLKLIIGKYIS
jgi:5'-methylthioadenosine phosphorylase